MTTRDIPPSLTATIIIGVRNAGDGVPVMAERLLDAVSPPGIDAVVIDDGSTDGTGGALAAAFDGSPSITLVRHAESAGIAARRNEALRLARGELIWFVDHDDEWSGAGLATLLASAGEADVVFARADFAWGPGAGDRRLVDGIAEAEPRTISREAGARMIVDGTIHGFLWSKLFRRDVLGVDPFPLQVSQSDIVGVARAVEGAKAIRVIPDVVYVYRRQPGSITRSRTPDIHALASAHDSVLSLLGSFATAAERDTFTARFLCLASVNTAVRWGVPRPVMGETVRAASGWARPLDLRAVAGRSRPLAAAMVLLRVAPPLLPVALRTALGTLDALRSLRSRLART
ncbi:glycosyltransferase involved in cell wall biosynthesis [Leifsonia sp. EB41]|uniref:glycosyltransferase family 2 protein n=1 Tax=Leifsonia sp. EB41 TaxID=3156260 RepID=UPI003518A6DB